MNFINPKPAGKDKKRKKVDGKETHLREAKEIEYQGETKSIRQWAKELGMSQATLSKRLRAGWSLEEATKPPRKMKQDWRNK